MPGSTLVLDNDNRFNGVCKVIVTAAQKIGNGSGFLFSFHSDENREIFGLLTCYHVIHIDRQQGIPGPAQVTLEFHASPQGHSGSVVTVNLAQKQETNATPILSPNHDIYFLELSNQFRQDMTTRGIPVYESMEPKLNGQVWIAQFPGGTRRYVASAILHSNLNPTERIFPHRVSTHTGSSGSPLLQRAHQGNNLCAIGMHHGEFLNDELHYNPPLNYATSIVTIKDILNYSLLHGTDSPLPAHPASAIMDSTTGKMIAYLINRTISYVIYQRALSIPRRSYRKECLPIKEFRHNYTAQLANQYFVGGTNP